MTGAEREALVAAGVVTPMSQNYLAWRRALLWLMAPLMPLLAWRHEERRRLSSWP